MLKFKQNSFGEIGHIPAVKIYFIPILYRKALGYCLEFNIFSGRSNYSFYKFSIKLWWFCWFLTEKCIRTNTDWTDKWWIPKTVLTPQSITSSVFLYFLSFNCQTYRHFLFHTYFSRYKPNFHSAPRKLLRYLVPGASHHIIIRNLVSIPKKSARNALSVSMLYYANMYTSYIHTHTM